MNWGMFGGQMGGNALSSIMNTMTSFGLADFQGKQARKAQKDAQQFAWLMARNRYKMTMGDLERSGLNPMLAIGGAMPNVPSPMASFGIGHAPAASAPDIIGGYKRAKALADELKTIKADRKTAEVEADTAEKTKKFVQHRLAQEMRFTENSANRMYEESEKAKHERVTAMYDSLNAYERFESTQAQKALLRAQIPAAELEAAIYEGNFGKAMKYWETFTRATGQLFSGFGGAAYHYGQQAPQEVLERERSHYDKKSGTRSTTRNRRTGRRPK